MADDLARGRDFQQVFAAVTQAGADQVFIAGRHPYERHPDRMIRCDAHAGCCLVEITPSHKTTSCLPQL